MQHMDELQELHVSHMLCMLCPHVLCIFAPKGRSLETLPPPPPCTASPIKIIWIRQWGKDRKIMPTHTCPLVPSEHYAIVTAKKKHYWPVTAIWRASNFEYIIAKVLYSWEVGIKIFFIGDFKPCASVFPFAKETMSVHAIKTPISNTLWCAAELHP